MKSLISLLIVATIATTTAMAYPIAIWTSCGIHNTDTELWEGMNEEAIGDYLEEACDQEQEQESDNPND